MSATAEDTMEVDDDMQMDEDPAPAELPMSTDEEEEGVGVEKMPDDAMASDSPANPVDVDIADVPKDVGEGSLEMEAEALVAPDVVNDKTAESTRIEGGVVPDSSATANAAEEVEAEDNPELSKDSETPGTGDGPAQAVNRGDLDLNNETEPQSSPAVEAGEREADSDSNETGSGKILGNINEEIASESNTESSEKPSTKESSIDQTQSPSTKEVSSTSEDIQNDVTEGPQKANQGDPLEQRASTTTTELGQSVDSDHAYTEDDSREWAKALVPSITLVENDSNALVDEPKSLSMELSEAFSVGGDQPTPEQVAEESKAAGDEAEATSKENSAGATEVEEAWHSPVPDHISVDGSSSGGEIEIPDHVSLGSDSDPDDPPAVDTGGDKSDEESLHDHTKPIDENEVTSSAAENQEETPLHRDSSSTSSKDGFELQIRSVDSLNAESRAAQKSTARGADEASSSGVSSLPIVVLDDERNTQTIVSKSLGGAQITLIGKPSDSEMITCDEPATSKPASSAAKQAPNSVSTSDSTTKSQYSVRKMTGQTYGKCLHCSEMRMCFWKVEVANKEYLVCSDKCLEAHRVQRRQIIENGAPPISNIIQMADLSQLQKVCSMCSETIPKPKTGSLTWEVMDFCNEDCLNKYQMTYISKCCNCKTSVASGSMGKYSVRFGHEVKQFCSPSCLDTYKKSIKTCSYCQKNLQDSPEGFLAAVGGKDQFRDFCSQECLDKYDCICNNTSASYSVATCVVCDNDKVAQYELLSGDQVAKLCTDICLAAYKFVNKIEVGVCGMCNKYYDKKSVDEHVTFPDDSAVTYCSKHCLNISVISKRKIVPCSWCKAKKYNFDMIYRKGSSDDGLYVCSVNCLALHDVSMKAIPPTKLVCSWCKKLEVSTYHITMSDATVRHFCCYDCVLAFQAPFNTSMANSNQPFPASAPKKNSKTTEAAAAASSLITASTNTGGPTITNVGTLKPAGPSQPLIQSAGTPLSNKFMNKTVPDFFTLKPLDMRNKWTQITTCAPACRNCKSKNQDNRTEQLENVAEQSNDNSKAVNAGNKETTKVFVPVPVPIYVPYPAAMWTLPSPVLFPVPVPFAVPIIVPTALENMNQVIDTMKEILERSGKESGCGLPNQPSTSSSDCEKSQEHSGAESDNCSKKAIKRKTRSFDDENIWDEEPEQPKRVRFSTDESRVQTTGPAKKKLKYTLGVEAWKYFVKRWNATLQDATEGDKNLLKIDLLSMSSQELNDALTIFVQKAKRPNGLKYRPDCTFYLCLGIQHYLFQNGRDDEIFCEDAFSDFTNALDVDARSFHSGPNPPVSRVEEEHLWESAQLGAKSPQLLLMTIMYFFTLHFELWTVEQHLQLTVKNFSVERYDDESCTRKLIKLKLDGEGSDPAKPREYVLTENENDVERCPVRIFEFYLSKCPIGSDLENDPLYLMPISACDPNNSVWYMSMPLPQQQIEKMIHRVKMIKEVCDAMNKFSADVTPSQAE